MAISSAKLESGLQLLARLSRKKFIETIYPSLFIDKLKPRDVIEIVGESGTGKSLLLSDIIAEVILPESLNGAETDVLLIHTDGNINFANITQTLLNKIRIKVKEEENMNLMNESISRLHMIETNDPLQFYTTIHNLENMIEKYSNISIVIIDTLTAYYWSEQNSNVSKMNTYLNNLLHLLKKVTKDLQIAVMYTRPQYYDRNKMTEFNKDQVSCRIELNLAKNINGFHEAVITKIGEKYSRYYRFANNNIEWIPPGS